MFGLISFRTDLHEYIGDDSYVIVLDGIILNYINNNLVKKFMERNIPYKLELAFLPKTTEFQSFQFPCVYLFSFPARMISKVQNQI